MSINFSERYYSSLTDEEWKKACQCSVLPTSTGFSVFKYIKYATTFSFNDLVINIDTLITLALKCLGVQRSPKFAWWHKVYPISTPNKTTNVYLGAVPIQRGILGFNFRNDAEVLQRQDKIDAVLTITESFENDHENLGGISGSVVRFFGMLTKPITPKEWSKRSVIQCQIPTPDFGTIEMEKIYQGVEFLNWNVKNGRNVYVHCKAGHGRSFLVLTAYLVKYQKLPVDTAIAKVRSTRWEAHLDKEKLETLRRYAALVQSR